jgi:predicted alpha-1,6-mannanase (GH76 family)
MINGDSLINDGLTDDCRNNNQATWSYNQGVILGALVELAKATGDNDGHINPARQIADAVLASSSLNPDGILREAGCGNR